MTRSLSVVGGGPAGLAVAHYATRAGIPTTLFERSAELGGLCRTFQCGAHRYDAGAHRFHDQDPESTADVRALLGTRLVAVEAPSRIYDGRRFIDFPPTPLGMLLSGGIAQIGRVARDLVRSRLPGPPCVSFADFAIAQFGETLARRFLIHYSEKLWGLPAEQLSPDIATRRLSGMTLRSLLVELLAPRRKVEHIDGRFLYPLGGYGELPAALAASVPARSLRTEHDVSGFEVRDDRITAIHLKGRPSVEVADRLVSTLPVTVLVRLLGDVVPETARRAAGTLRFRSVRLMFVRLARSRVSPSASLYLPDPSLCVARVTEPKNRSPHMAPAHETSLVAEVPCFAGDPLAKLSDVALAERVTDELAGVGLIAPREVLEWRHHLLPNAYPVYALDWSRTVAAVVAGLRPLRNLDLLGRGGLFFYSHLHDQLRLGREFVRHLGRPEARPDRAESRAEPM
ncbi:MAG TPA: FAD-dependent oxidoreductase [Candidatus Eisenbacteria bacterium]|nr:FAD-dependent oxidoreductase [Candidatus Eisenbacteria bacterium]